jgi:hypothetical protein
VDSYFLYPCDNKEQPGFFYGISLGCSLAKRSTMKEVVTGAIRYLLGNKKLILLNISFLTSGLLIIIFAVFLSKLQNEIDNSFIAQSVAMAFLGFSVLYNYYLINIRNSYLREREIGIRIMLGSGFKRIYSQITAEGLFQIIISLIVALAVTDISFTLLNIQSYLQVSILPQGGSRILLYVLVLWLFTGFIIVVLQNKWLKKPRQRDYLLKCKPDQSSASGKIIFGMQFISLNISVFTCDISAAPFTGLSRIFHGFILLLGIYVVTTSFIVSFVRIK